MDMDTKYENQIVSLDLSYFFLIIGCQNIVQKYLDYSPNIFLLLCSCTFDGTPNQLLGVAFDGIPILSPIDTDGTRLTTDDLDMCHGKFDEDGMYRYRITYEFPYILG